MPVLTKIHTGAIGDAAVTAAKIAVDTIAATDIASNAVGASELADNAVTNIKLADEGTITQSAIKRSIHKAWIMG